MPSAFPQGTFAFSGGIAETAPLSFSVTHGHGIDPAIFHVKVYATDIPPQKNGDVTLRYGTNKPIVFKNCTIDRMTKEAGPRLVWDLQILDRRYLWRWPIIDGVYNARWKNGSELRDETKKKPSELVELCFKRMGETNYDLGAIKDFDNLDWPEINWNSAWAANEAQLLCERYGCRFIYTWQGDRVIVVNVGTGQELDTSGAIPLTEESPEFNPPEKPGRIIVLGAPTSIQADIPLIPMAVDVDGTIKPIKDVSYAPTAPQNQLGVPNVDFSSGSYLDAPAGFWNMPNMLGFFEGLPTPHLRHLAAENIFRLYQVSFPEKFPGLNKARGDLANDKSLPDLESLPSLNAQSSQNAIWRIALQSEQNDRLSVLENPLTGTVFNEYNKEVSSACLPAWVYGQYANQLNPSVNVLPDIVSQNGNVTNPGIFNLKPGNVVSQEIYDTSTEPSKLTNIDVTQKVLESGYCDVPFTIIPEWGLIKFAEPVWQVQPPKKSGVIATFSDGSMMPSGVINFPPSLWLRTRFYLRDPQTRGWVRPARVRVLDKNNKTTRYVIRDDLVLKMWARPAGTVNISKYPPRFPDFNGETNGDAFAEAADAYLDQIEAEYQTLTPQGVVYAGFIPMTLDGAIRDISWFVGEDGRAYTRVMRNQEYIVWHQDYAERRLAERTKAKDNQKPDPKPPDKDMPPPGMGVF